VLTNVRIVVTYTEVLMSIMGVEPTTLQAMANLDIFWVGDRKQ